MQPNAAANDAFFAFKTNWSARALIGLLGSDDFSLKVSPDGLAFHEAIRIDRTSSRVEMPEPVALPALDAVPAPPPSGKLALYARDRAGAGWPDVQRPSGRFFPLQPHFGVNRIATWVPSTGTTLFIACALAANTVGMGLVVDDPAVRGPGEAGGLACLHHQLDLDALAGGKGIAHLVAPIPGERVCDSRFDRIGGCRSFRRNRDRGRGDRFSDSGRHPDRGGQCGKLRVDPVKTFRQVGRHRGCDRC